MKGTILIIWQFRSYGRKVSSRGSMWWFTSNMLIGMRKPSLSLSATAFPRSVPSCAVIALEAVSRGLNPPGCQLVAHAIRGNMVGAAISTMTSSLFRTARIPRGLWLSHGPWRWNCNTTRLKSTQSRQNSLFLEIYGMCLLLAQGSASSCSKGWKCRKLSTFRLIPTSKTNLRSFRNPPRMNDVSLHKHKYIPLNDTI